MYKEIALSKGFVSIVDEEDYPMLSLYSWHCGIGGGKNLYARRITKGKTIRMHTDIMNPPPGFVVDHINGDSLDNRKGNLRICTPQQNMMNLRARLGKGASPFKGVSKVASGRWRAAISLNNKNKTIGVFDSDVDAALAYDFAASLYYGEFAVTNQMLGNYAHAASRNQSGV